MPPSPGTSLQPYQIFLQLCHPVEVWLKSRESNYILTCNDVDTLTEYRKLPNVSSLTRLLSLTYNSDQFGIMGNCPATPPLPLPSKLTLTSRLGQNIGLGEGQVGSFPES